MNFLAHAYLSGDNEELLVGNFIGDFVKGKAFENYPEAIAKGIQLHRAIDEFTDNHTITTESKQPFRKKYRHYAGVIVDVMYDHFLANSWENYHELSLENYTTKIYATLNDYNELFPERFKYMFSYMSRDNWLLNYSKLEGIDRALTGMSRRTKFDSKMEDAVADIRKDYQLFKEHFEEFIPQAENFVGKWLKENNQ